MRPGYNTKSVTVRVPAIIYHEIQKRMTGGGGQTEVILEALCRAFEIKNPRPRKTTGDNHEKAYSQNT